MFTIAIIELLYNEYNFQKIKEALILQGVDIDILESRISRLELMQRLEETPQFRKEEHVVRIIKEMNRRTEFGRELESNITGKELIELVKDVKEPARTVRMCVHELEEHGLIQKNNLWSENEMIDERIQGLDFLSILTTSDFCSKTDGLCRNWDLPTDAVKAIKLAGKQENRTILCENIMNSYNWDIRKMNSVLKFMEGKNLIEQLEPSGGDNLWDYYFCLTNEADFFQEKYDVYYLEVNQST